MVEAARIAYRDFPTVVNEVGESSLLYDNTMEDYARMDSSMQSAQKAIGGSSDVAQLSQSYYWDKVARNIYDDERQQYYENTVILAVAAQLAIDGVKRLYEVDVNNDIARIRSQPCMSKEKDYPKFMKWTHEIQTTKNGKERPQDDIKKEKNRVKNRVDESLICPMNYVEDFLDKIQGAPRSDYVDNKEFFVKIPGAANHKQMSAIRKIIDEYDGHTKRILLLLQDNPDSDELVNLLCEKSASVLDELSKRKISRYTMNRLIGSVLGIDWGVNNKYKHKITSKYTRKMLNLLYKTNREGFLMNFVKNP